MSPSVSGLLARLALAGAAAFLIPALLGKASLPPGLLASAALLRLLAVVELVRLIPALAVAAFSASRNPA